MMLHFNHGSLLVSALKEKGMTKSDLAREVGASRQLVHHWCSQDTLTFKNIFRICQALTLEPVSFMEESHD